MTNPPITGEAESREAERQSLAYSVANARQGQSETPRCEPPGAADVKIARFWVDLVLDAIHERAPAPIPAAGPTKEQIARQAYAHLHHLMRVSGYEAQNAYEKLAASILALFKEGRSEQDLAQVVRERDAAIQNRDYYAEERKKAWADLAAAKLRIQGLEEREQHLVTAINDALESVVEITHPKHRSEGGLGLAVAPQALQRLEDLVFADTTPPAAEEARKEDSPSRDPGHQSCGERDEAGLGATAALAGGEGQ